MGVHQWQSEEDQTLKISKSVYVTNFPETCFARDLWKVCNDYGTVVDVFIPFKKSKAGKLFAFVRFIKVKEFDRLVENLCTIWIGRFYIHANVAHFHRPLKPNTPIPREPNLGTSKNSFASVLKEGSLSPIKEFVNSERALVLDETCIKEHDFSLSLMGKVKTVSTIPNFPIILSNEGFHNIKITYLGRMWVLFGMESLESKDKILNHTGVNSWFLTIKEAYNSFVCDERITWVSIEGLPIKAWMLNSFCKIASLWGEFVEREDSDSFALSNKPLCLKTKIDDSINERCKIIIQEDIIGENFVGNKDKIDSSDIDRVSKSSFSHANDLVHDTSNKNVTGLIDLPLEGYTYTWAHKSASKMSKLDRFLISDGLLLSFLHLSAICLDRHLSDHRPILLKENTFDFGPTPFRIFYSWFSMNEEELELLKNAIKVWIKEARVRSTEIKNSIHQNLSEVDEIIDQGLGNDEHSRFSFDYGFPSRLSIDQVEDLERIVTLDEVKRTIWDCGANKSAGPDGFTFEFFRKFWTIIDNDVFTREFQSDFVSNHNILDGPFMLDELLLWCKHKRKSTMIFKVDFEKAFDSVKWDYILDTLKAFGFGQKWCKWINGWFDTAMVSILVNGSPTSKFQFHKGLKQGDPISSFIFILIMETLHLSFNRVIDANLFKGVGVKQDEVKMAANLVGCSNFTSPFKYLGVKVGDNMSRFNSWDEVISKVSNRLSNWKLKALSIGGRLTLIKSVLSLILLYHMSIFKAPMGVLNKLESIRRKFFNGTDGMEKKISWIDSSLWSRFIKAMHGNHGALTSRVLALRRSPWLDVIRDIHSLNSKGIDHMQFLKKKIDNDENTSFWDDKCLNDEAFKSLFPRPPRGGIEEEQLTLLSSRIIDISLPNMSDRWLWSLEAFGSFSVRSARIYIDENILPKVDVPTRWVKIIPIKVNIHAWKWNLHPIFSFLVPWLDKFGAKLRIGGRWMLPLLFAMKIGLIGLATFDFLSN
uniref:RNA-directed DNA polymerase, eukaryota n=1 Tax=Tanacetum cinerariifolium TaxID=118510 RepID=A0A699HU18_TANCI|nr:RNA-directed DNA polymerase, eukaryota [Tanacetum cinerariifolium]